MSDWAGDVAWMHKVKGFREAFDKMDARMRMEDLAFRIKFLQEEMEEIEQAFVLKKSDALIDGIIDLIVVAVGILDANEVKVNEAWAIVHAANMAKEKGIKVGRENPLGLPDLRKPEGWEPPTHEGNHGVLDKAFGAKGYDYYLLCKMIENTTTTNPAGV